MNNMDNQKSMDLGAVKEQIGNTRRSWTNQKHGVC
jgi:hypothetical protein